MFVFNGKSYKHRAFFEAFARTVPPVNKDKVKLVIASLNSLTGIFDEEVLKRIRANPDLLAVCSNLILADHANKNDDCLTKESLLQVAQNFEYKFFNADHDRAQCFGVIDEVGWSLYPSNEIIDKENVAGESGLIQLVIGGYLWRIVNPDLCNLIEDASNENSPNYLKVSTSFEFLFNDYTICLSPDKNCKNPNARIIGPEDEDFSKYDKKLKVNGGDGKDGGMNVFRILRTEILPVGAGVVRKPASGLKGIAVVTPSSELKKEEIDASHPLAEHLDAQEKNIIQENLSVKENKSTNTIMVITSLNDIQANFEGFGKLPAGEAVASIQKLIESKITELSEQHAKDAKAKEDAANAAISAKAELEERAKNLGKAVEDLQKQLDDIASKQAAAANEAAFNSRMAALDEVFDLDDDDRAILVDEVKALESEAAFMPWMDKKKKLMKEKTKAYKKDKAKCMEEKMTKAGIKFTLDEKTLDIKEVFASVTETVNEPKIPNGAPDITKDLSEVLKGLRAGLSVAGVKTE